MLGSGPVPTPFGWSKRDADEYVQGRWGGSMINVSVNPKGGETSFVEVDPFDGYVAFVIGLGLVIGSLSIVWSWRRSRHATGPLIRPVENQTALPLLAESMAESDGGGVVQGPSTL